MKTSQISVNFKQIIATIKPLHGVNNSPVALKEPPEGFSEAGFPFCRLHDAAGPYGGTHFVDVPNIFPDFKADPNDLNSYDFAFTDAYLKQLNASGVEIFYRLGTTIENNYRIKGYNNHPPENFKKWAEICAGIIRHYNHGWGNGFHYNIRYWEIWNEPEQQPMWTGTNEEFFEFYSVAARYLKEKFPDIYIGGYGSCGFYSVTRPDASEFFGTFPIFFEKFLKYVTSPKTAAPLDFFTWHLYSDQPEEPAIHAAHVSKVLKKFGLEKTENIFGEWNYIGHGFDAMKEAPGASFVASTFCLLQNSPVDKALYYDAFPARKYCGLYYYPSENLTPTYYSFRAFNELYKLKQQCEVITDLTSELYLLAAADDSDNAILLVNNAKSGRIVKMEMIGKSTKKMTCRITDKCRVFQEIPFDGESIQLPPFSVALFTTRLEEAGSSQSDGEKIELYAALDEGL